MSDLELLKKFEITHTTFIRWERCSGAPSGGGVKGGLTF